MAFHTAAAVLCHELAGVASSSQGSALGGRTRGLGSTLSARPSSSFTASPYVRQRYKGLYRSSSEDVGISDLSYSKGLWSTVGQGRNSRSHKERKKRGIGVKSKAMFGGMLSGLCKGFDAAEKTRQECSGLVNQMNELEPELVKLSINRLSSTVPCRSRTSLSTTVVKAESRATEHNPVQSAKNSIETENCLRAGRGEYSECVEKVIVSTTLNSKTAKVLGGEPEYVSQRYVKGSVKYQIELEQSFRLENPSDEEEENARDAWKDAESALESNVDSVGTDQVSTSDQDEGFWSSETYLRQLLTQRRRSKQVILSVVDEDIPRTSARRFEARERRNNDLDDAVDKGYARSQTAKKDQPVDEDEFILRKALKKKREIAEETLESAIRAAGVGPTYCKDVMARLSPFVDRIVTEAVYLKKYPAYKLLSFNSRARLYLDQCNVVALIKWLKHQNLTVPRIGSLICLADENLERIRPRIELLKSIFVKGRELGAVIEREPSILNQSLAELHNTIEVLETAGIEKKWLGLVVNRSPKVFSVGNKELLGKISMFTELGIPPEEFGLLVFKFPAVLGHLSVEEMMSKIDYLRQIGIEDDVLRRMIVSTPQLLACSIDESWDKMLRYFYYLRIEISGIRRVLGVQPEVFCLNLEENIAPKVRFLQAIRVDDDAIGQVIVSFPAILTYSLDKKIRPVVRFLLEGAGVAEADIGKVIALKPELIGCSLKDKLQPIVKWFGSHRIPPRLLGGMVANFPALLMYSKPTLHPKIRYFKRVMKRPLDDLIGFPRYFSYSLKSRIMPRHELLKKKGLTFSLKYMLACNDETFLSRVAAAESRYADQGKMEEDVESASEDMESDEKRQEDVTFLRDEIKNMSIVS